MKDFLYISHRFKKEDISHVERALIDYNLSNIVSFEKEGFLSGLCSVRLPINDNRIDYFKNLIEEKNEKPLIRFDREYSKLELDKFDYLVLSIATSGLDNPVDSQKYDSAKACSECGAGLIPIEPLIIPQNSMGKKLLDKTGHNNWLVFHSILAEKIKQNAFTGISFHTTKIGRNENDYKWGKIDNELPKLSSSSKFRKNHSLCTTCNKSGNFDNFDTETKFIYNNDLFDCFNDFNSTLEYFGEWKYSEKGGSQHVIISQRVRQFLLKEKVKHLKYRPIEKNK